MKNLGKIIQRYKQVRFRYLKKFLDGHLNKESKNCVYNRPTTFSQGGYENVCMCGLGFEKKEWLGGACDIRLNPNVALECPSFEPLYAKEDLKKVFQDFLDTSEYDKIAKHYPDLSVLLWVLDTLQEGSDSESESEENPEED